MKPLRARLQEARKRLSLPWEILERDYYDLWRVLGTYGNRLDLSDFPIFLRDKCATHGVTFSGPDSFSPEAMLVVMEKTWKQWLGPLVPTLPPYKTVIEELRPQVAALLASRG